MSKKKSNKKADKKDEKVVEPIIGEGKRRIFVYDENTYEDPGSEFSDADVLLSMAAMIPALAGGTIERVDHGSYVEVKLVRKPKKLG